MMWELLGSPHCGPDPTGPQDPGLLRSSHVLGAPLSMFLSPCPVHREIFPYLVVVIGLENVLVLTKSVVSTPVDLEVKLRIAQGNGGVGGMAATPPAKGTGSPGASLALASTKMPAC